MRRLAERVLLSLGAVLPNLAMAAGNVNLLRVDLGGGGACGSGGDSGGGAADGSSTGCCCVNAWLSSPSSPFSTDIAAGKGWVTSTTDPRLRFVALKYKYKHNY